MIINFFDIVIVVYNFKNFELNIKIYEQIFQLINQMILQFLSKTI